MTAQANTKGTTETTVYVATAPLVLVKDSNGATHHVYDGELLPKHTAPGEVERLLELGFIAATDANPADE